MRTFGCIFSRPHCLAVLYQGYESTDSRDAVWLAYPIMIYESYFLFTNIQVNLASVMHYVNVSALGRVAPTCIA